MSGDEKEEESCGGGNLGGNGTEAGDLLAVIPKRWVWRGNLLDTRGFIYLFIYFMCVWRFEVGGGEGWGGAEMERKIK